MLSITLILSISILGSCQQSNTSQSTNSGATIINDKIEVNEFEKLIANNPNAQLIDVRTPEEFLEGHLENATNINYNGDNFEAAINKLDKTKPVLVYCMSGGRSSSAASKMKDLGFKEVHNLSGGIMKWKAANKAVTTSTNATGSKGMSLADFQKNIISEKYILVDFNAKWCAPCQKMLPTLEKLAESKSDKLDLLKIDADQNPELMQAKKIDGIPYLELYKDGKLIWTHKGFIEEATLLQETKL